MKEYEVRNNKAGKLLFREKLCLWCSGVCFHLVVLALDKVFDIKKISYFLICKARHVEN